MGDDRADGLSAIGDRGQAAMSLTPDIDGMHVHIFESLQLASSYVGDLLNMSVHSSVIHSSQRTRNCTLVHQLITG